MTKHDQILRPSFNKLNKQHSTGVFHKPDWRLNNFQRIGTTHVNSVGTWGQCWHSPALWLSGHQQLAPTWAIANLLGCYIDHLLVHWVSSISPTTVWRLSMPTNLSPPCQHFSAVEYTWQFHQTDDLTDYASLRSVGWSRVSSAFLNDTTIPGLVFWGRNGFQLVTFINSQENIDDPG